MSATIRDLFCGAGGSSLGAELAGTELKHALNHWDRAVETHALNFQDADHSCADIASLTTSQIRRFDPTDILWASPECTNHSLAKGGQRKPPQAGSLFDDGPAGDAEQDRSRATMWDVVRFCEQAMLRGAPYKAVIVENVVDVVKWGNADDGGLFNAWLIAMNAMGYEHECVFLNSMVCWPTPQSRDRVYVVFWMRGMRRPNLRYEPPCWCPTCSKVVNGIQTWKKPAGDPNQGRVWGRYGIQYFYSCGDCRQPALPAVFPAGSIIDFDVQATRIGDRKKPLAPATRDRIMRGLTRLAQEPFAIRLTHGGQPRPLTLPMVTLTRRHDPAMVFPVAGNTFEPPPGNRGRDAVLVPMDTVHTSLDRAMVFSNRNNNVPRDAELHPSHPVLTGGHLGVVEMQNHGVVEPLRVPVHTVRAGGFHHAIVMPYNRTGLAQSAREPTPTLTTRDRLALLVPGCEETPGSPAPELSEKDIDNCRFRMFSLDEIAGAMVMRVHSDGSSLYEVTGNKREQMAQYGNAVTPPAARELVGRVLEVI